MKTFFLAWGAGYIPHDQKSALTETQPENYFCEDQGYWPEHIEMVKNLVLGESVNLTEMGQIHSVTRLT